MPTALYPARQLNVLRQLFKELELASGGRIVFKVKLVGACEAWLWPCAGDMFMPFSLRGMTS